MDSAWGRSMLHVGEQVKSELRRNASGFLSYWDSNTQSLVAGSSFELWANAFIDTSIGQLRHIAARLRDGHDEPADSRSGNRALKTSVRDGTGSKVQVGF
jgi:hypothetical protein